MNGVDAKKPNWKRRLHRLNSAYDQRLLSNHQRYALGPTRRNVGKRQGVHAASTGNPAIVNDELDFKVAERRDGMTVRTFSHAGF